MISGLLITLMCSLVMPAYAGNVPIDAVRMRATCYLPTGNCAYDGTPCYEGMISCNVDHVGMEADLYTIDGRYLGRFKCHDIGGNVMLRNGTAIDIYREDMNRALAWVRENGDYLMVRWIEKGE